MHELNGAKILAGVNLVVISDDEMWFYHVPQMHLLLIDLGLLSFPSFVFDMSIVLRSWVLGNTHG